MYTHQLSPERSDAFSAKTPDISKRKYGDIMNESLIENERAQHLIKITQEKKLKE